VPPGAAKALKGKARIAVRKLSIRL
jgi:hypothetical protein